MTVSDVHVAIKTALCVGRSKRGLVWEPLREPPWYSQATAPSDCKVGNEINFRELVYLMNVTLLRVATALI